MISIGPLYLTNKVVKKIYVGRFYVPKKLNIILHYSPNKQILANRFFKQKLNSRHDYLSAISIFCGVSRSVVTPISFLLLCDFMSFVRKTPTLRRMLIGREKCKQIWLVKKRKQILLSWCVVVRKFHSHPKEKCQRNKIEKNSKVSLISRNFWPKFANFSCFLSAKSWRF